MHEILSQAFSWVCGQNPAHTWTCSGLALPCCQRCTGLYLGALASFLLQHLLRPRMNSRFLQIHGAFLIVMVPFGFHWLPQGPLLRAWSGMLFGFALVTFLRLSLVHESAGSEFDAGQRTRRRLYWGGLMGALAGLGFLDHDTAKTSGVLISMLLVCGALSLWSLAAGNLWQGVRWVLGRFRFITGRVAV